MSIAVQSTNDRQIASYGEAPSKENCCLKRKKYIYNASQIYQSKEFLLTGVTKTIISVTCGSTKCCSQQARFLQTRETSEPKFAGSISFDRRQLKIFFIYETFPNIIFIWKFFSGGICELATVIISHCRIVKFFFLISCYLEVLL